MAVPNNRIDKDHVDPRAGVAGAAAAPAIPVQEYEYERRAEEIILGWLKVYFSGNSFSVRERDGQETVREFVRCDLLVGEAEMPQPAARPVIHAVLADEQNERICHGEEGFLVRSEMRWNVFVRTTRQTVDAGVGGRHLASRVAAQLKWLLEGTERQGLSDRGLVRARISRGPVPIQNPNYFVRQFVLTTEAYYRLNHNV